MHAADCRCVMCLMKPGETCAKARYCIATSGHPGACVHAIKAPLVLAKLFAIGVAKYAAKIGGAT